MGLLRTRNVNGNRRWSTRWSLDALGWEVLCHERRANGATLEVDEHLAGLVEAKSATQPRSEPISIQTHLDVHREDPAGLDLDCRPKRH